MESNRSINQVKSGLNVHARTHTEIDVNEYEHFLKVTLDQSEIDIQFRSLLVSVNVF